MCVALMLLPWVARADALDPALPYESASERR
jgi:hypothetical protein